jgi:hypothetical protein
MNKKALSITGLSVWKKGYHSQCGDTSIERKISEWNK